MPTTDDEISQSCLPHEKQASLQWLTTALEALSTSTYNFETSELLLKKQSQVDLPILTEPSWHYLWTIARQHRLVGMLHCFLESVDTQSAIPSSLRDKITHVYHHIQRGNALRFMSCAAILQAFEDQKIVPILLKGILLADSFYPNSAMRPMGDIDLLIRRQDFFQCHDALRNLKFQHIEKTDSADHYVNQLGLKIDLHTTFTLFSDFEQYTVLTNPRHIPYPSISGWEPHALLVHLIVHLVDHAGKTGHLLIWVMDVVFVLRQFQEQLNESILRELFPSPHYMRCFARILGFANQSLSFQLSEWQGQWAKRFEPYTIQELVLHRQMGIWRLYSRQGWIGLLAEKFQINTPSGRSFPTSRDYLQWAKNLLRRSLENKRHQYIDRDT